MNASVSLDRDDPPKEDRASRITGERQCLAALDDAAGADPPAAPDQAGGLVVASPDEGLLRGHRVHPGPADQRGEDRVTVPAWDAHPAKVPLWAHDHAAFPVGEKGVLPQHARRVPQVGRAQGPRPIDGSPASCGLSAATEPNFVTASTWSWKSSL